MSETPVDVWCLKDDGVTCVFEFPRGCPLERLSVSLKREGDVLRPRVDLRPSLGLSIYGGPLNAQTRMIPFLELGEVLMAKNRWEHERRLWIIDRRYYRMIVSLAAVVGFVLGTWVTYGVAIWSR